MCVVLKDCACVCSCVVYCVMLYDVCVFLRVRFVIVGFGCAAEMCVLRKRFIV